MINLAFDEYNQSVDNSGIGSTLTNKITKAWDPIQITFPSNNNPEEVDANYNTVITAPTAAARVRDESQVQTYRNTYDADLVVCFVGFMYGTNVGSVTHIPANNYDNSFIVTAPFAIGTGIHTFAHEMGHMLGARHETDAGSPSYSHGYLFTSGISSYRTIMHTDQSGSTRIMYFSNPNINYNGVPTGTVSTNHEARVISENSPTIVNLKPSTTQSFNAAIVGPTGINSSGYYSWELYTFCRNFLTTTWQFSTDGFNYGSPVGSGDAVNFYYLDNNNNGTLFLRCTITTDQYQTYVTTSTINVNICSGCRTAVEEPKEISEVASSIKAIFPNPAYDRLTVEYNLREKTDLQFEFVDYLGRSRGKNMINQVDRGVHKSEIDISLLEAGPYICRILLNGIAVNKPIIVSK
ncbi:M12 family metallo-peptidase [Runella sp.]|uniref:M12 family metallo-peptidase n=1 Tax=Runella sp. TaxID=1960881 RepID=UPI003D12E34E